MGDTCDVQGLLSQKMKNYIYVYIVFALYERSALRALGSTYTQNPFIRIIRTEEITDSRVARNRTTLHVRTRFS